MTNETAFTPNTHETSVSASSNPPITGPIAMPACTPSVTRLFAHEMSSGSSTRFGIAAREADRNGSSAIAEANASRISASGECTNTIAAKNTHEIASDQISTLRRSSRSPRAPANGPISPATPNVNSSDNACMNGECVRSQTVKLSAVNAAAPPVTDSRRPRARRLTLDRGERLMKRTPCGGGAGGAAW